MASTEIHASSSAAMQIGGRPLGTILGAPFEARHWRALTRMMRIYPSPIAMLGRYLFRAGRYPLTVTLQGNGRPFDVTLFSHHDLLTLNEVFCREDYPAGADVRTVVDFGSNIGITALYFLTRNDTCRVHLYEPVPMNVTRLEANLRGFEDRYIVHRCAVGTEDGEVAFGVEDSGRYGGIGVEAGRTLEVPCMAVSTVFEELAREHDVTRVDIVKVDIEGMEETVVRRLGDVGTVEIDTIYAEMDGSATPLEGYRFTQRGAVARWRRRALRRQSGGG